MGFLDKQDLLAYIIKTNDRNLALIIGRSLGAQKFFNDVTYTHKLRDSPNELYKFQVWDTETPDAIDSQRFPIGVVTLLTDCYSPTCTKDTLCYSITCPRRIEQQARLTRIMDTVKRRPSRDSLMDKSRKVKTLASIYKQCNHF